MEVAIYNIADLRNEIDRLKAIKKEQEIVIASHFNSPSAIFHTVTSFFKGSGASAQSGGGLLGGQDVVSLISRFALPFILNKTLFRGSNFIIKTLVGLLSQKASGFINEKSVVTAWDKIRSVVPNLIHKIKDKKKPAEYSAPRRTDVYQ